VSGAREKCPFPPRPRRRVARGPSRRPAGGKREHWRVGWRQTAPRGVRSRGRTPEAADVPRAGLFPRNLASMLAVPCQEPALPPCMRGPCRRHTPPRTTSDGGAGPRQRRTSLHAPRMLAVPGPARAAPHVRSAPARAGPRPRPCRPRVPYPPPPCRPARQVRPRLCRAPPAPVPPSPPLPPRNAAAPGCLSCPRIVGTGASTAGRDAAPSLSRLMVAASLPGRPSSPWPARQRRPRGVADPAARGTLAPTSGGTWRSLAVARPPREALVALAVGREGGGAMEGWVC